MDTLTIEARRVRAERVKRVNDRQAIASRIIRNAMNACTHSDERALFLHRTLKANYPTALLHGRMFAAVAYEIARTYAHDRPERVMFDELSRLVAREL
jgi:hypothetical protein